MSTMSTLGYLDDFGEFRGTTIHWDGMTVGATANDLLRENGSEWLMKFIDAGIGGGGYANLHAAAKPFNDKTEPEVITAGIYFDAVGIEYGWVLTDEGVKPLEQHLYEQKRMDLGFWDCWLKAEKQTPSLSNPLLLAATESHARETYANEPEILAYILKRLKALSGL